MTGRPALPAPEPLVRVESLPVDVFRRDHLERGRPVLIAGGASEWSAVRRWDAPYLTQRLGGRRVRVAVSTGDVFGYDSESAGFEQDEMTFAEALDRILHAPGERRYYLMQKAIALDFPELLEDVPRLDHVGGARTSPHLWIGTARNVSPLHYDMANNLFAQVAGRKEFLLFPPEQAECLAPHPPEARHHNLSHVDLEHPDLERFPGLAKTSPLIGLVEPGDLLFLPAFWWHHVRSLDAGVSLSVWWAPLPEQFLAPRGRLMLRALYARDRLISLRGPLQDNGGPLAVARRLLEPAPDLSLLLAAAALEERLRSLYQRRQSRAEADALRDSARLLSELTSAGVVGAGDAREAERVLACAQRALDGGPSEPDARASLAAVEAFLASVAPAGPGPVSPRRASRAGAG